MDLSLDSEPDEGTLWTCSVFPDGRIGLISFCTSSCVEVNPGKYYLELMKPQQRFQPLGEGVEQDQTGSSMWSISPKWEIIRA